MNVRAVGISAVAAAIAMFAWQSVSQTVIPWHSATMHEMSDTTAGSIAAVRALAKDNGVYFSRYGVLMSVRIAADKSDQTSMAAMLPMLGKQAGVDLVVAFALCILVGFLVDRSALGVAKATSLAGFSMIAMQELAMSTWYGFPMSWSLVNIADQTLTFFLAGLVIGALMSKFDAGAGVSIPEGQGYRTSGGRKTVAN